ncbi:hypothetical protein AVEN_220998-1 [Araneus ventricosus]|uniref:Reverse transcriptase domain-containing protein n=1 Tax=Araneus ventricosus TaxID=182803 RepID=A0A4Y2ER89_ARAVE|nr:hypothetical protein AVEN_220998-1 [Araneus ventricosus]
MFWNLVANEILSEEWQPDIHLQAFADVFIFVISEPMGAKLKATAQATLTKAQHWTDKNKLKVSTEKSTTILISRLHQETISRVCFKKSPSSAGKKWDNGETGGSVYKVLPQVKTTTTPWQRPEIKFAKGPRPISDIPFKRFKIRNSDPCGCRNLGNPYTMLPAACLQPNTT